jgi:hypothetical protein
MDTPITLRFVPTKQDYANVLRLFFLLRTSTRVSLGFLAVAFGLIIFSVASQGTLPSAFQLVWLLLPPLFLVYVFFYQPSRMASQAMSNEQLAAEATWELTDSGVNISSRFGETQMGWDDLQKLVVTKSYYLLLNKANKNTFRFIPRRAFTSAQETEQFLAIVKEHIPIT